MKKILLVIDMQNDFVDGALGTKEAQAMVPALLHKIEEEVAKGTELIFTQDTHGENYMDTQEGRKLPVSHCIRGTSGWKIIPALQPYAKTVIEKPTFGSFELIEKIKRCSLLDNIDIEIVGYCTDICIVSNALVMKAGFYDKANITVDASCCAGVTPESYKAALLTMKMCQINIVNE